MAEEVEVKTKVIPMTSMGLMDQLIGKVEVRREGDKLFGTFEVDAENGIFFDEWDVISFSWTFAPVKPSERL